MHLFQYAVIWTPTEKDAEDNGTKPKLLVEITPVLSDDVGAATIIASRAIPQEYVDKNELDQITLIIRPF